MILYHGSTVIVEKPLLLKHEQGRDFGTGFYTTDIQEQAIRWAKRKARIASHRGKIVKGIVSRYNLDMDKALSSLRIKHFREPDKEWLDMICACRSNSSFIHGFDLVIGKIATDAVGETVSYVVQGIMRPEDALERLRFEHINNQICFNTDAALSHLEFIAYEVYEVYDGARSD